MRDIERIHKYIAKTEMPAEISDRYQMDPKDLIAIVDAAKGIPTAAALLAFTFGKAKGYRAGKSEAQREK